MIDTLREKPILCYHQIRTELKSAPPETQRFTTAALKPADILGKCCVKLVQLSVFYPYCNFGVRDYFQLGAAGSFFKKAILCWLCTSKYNTMFKSWSPYSAKLLSNFARRKWGGCTWIQISVSPYNGHGKRFCLTFRKWNSNKRW